MLQLYEIGNYVFRTESINKNCIKRLRNTRKNNLFVIPRDSSNNTEFQIRFLFLSSCRRYPLYDSYSRHNVEYL